MNTAEWPCYDEPPSVAFVDVDGTLLAHTTTFLFARILYRRGLIRRSFFLRAAYHGLQHRFGRLDYGRLIEIGLSYIQRIPVVELERIAYENFVGYVGYQPPITAIDAQALFDKDILPKTLANTVVTHEDYANGNGYLTLSSKGRKLWDDAWTDFRNG